MQNDIPIRNAVRVSPTRIDCEILHPVFGWLPFSADANDAEPHGRAIYDSLTAVADQAAP